ncbi:hypothetical protein PLICRDRAFT_154351 [Plicaturopsis crispa FD-325 SS-3]|nr:hypothetical protein PLICRDRAFT_154351 [Plicaturopsis crispa FD-325 SS-3]
MASPDAPGFSRRLGFIGMVGAVMTALHLKDRWDDYKQVSSDEEEGLIGGGRVALHDDDEITLHSNINTDLPTRRRREKKRGCCVCCGINCGLLWKAIGIVVGIFFAWSLIKLVLWAVTPAKTGLENMPVYSSSLGCIDAPHLYNNSKVGYSVPLDHSLGHEFEIMGSLAVGTLSIAQGAADATEVVYEMTLRSDLDTVDTSTVDRSVVRLNAYDDSKHPSSCLRYDVTLFVPPNLSTLDIKTRSVSHIQFDPASRLTLDRLFVTMYAMDVRSMLLPHEGVHATTMSLEAMRGWIVGDAAIVDKTSISTQRGDATTSVRVHPLPDTKSPESPATAHLDTVSGAGRTDIFYINDKGYPHRPIDSVHRSSRNGDIYLTYKEAEYNGYVNVSSKSMTAHGVQNALSRPGATGDDSRAYVGDKDGGDKLSIKSPYGWVGLYF